MLTITLTLTDQTTRVLCYADTIDTARTIGYDYGHVNLTPDGTATVAALNGAVTIGTWTVTETDCPPDSAMVTWIGPDAPTSAIVARRDLHTWLAARIEPLMATHPDLIGFGGEIGVWVNRDVTATVRKAIAGWAADDLAESLLAGTPSKPRQIGGVFSCLEGNNHAENLYQRVQSERQPIRRRDHQ